MGRSQIHVKRSCGAVAVDRSHQLTRRCADFHISTIVFLASQKTPHQWSNRLLPVKIIELPWSSEGTISNCGLVLPQICYCCCVHRSKLSRSIYSTPALRPSNLNFPLPSCFPTTTLTPSQPRRDARHRTNPQALKTRSSGSMSRNPSIVG